MQFSGRKGAAGKGRQERSGSGSQKEETGLPIPFPAAAAFFPAACPYRNSLLLEAYSQPAKHVPIINFGRSRLFGVSVVKREFTRYCAKKE